MTEETKAPTNSTPAPDSAPADSPPDPNVVASLSDQQVQNWRGLQRNAQQIIMELGNMMVRAVRSVGKLDEMDGSLRAMVNGVTADLNLPPSTQYQLLPNGDIRVLANVQPQVDQPVAVKDGQDAITSDMSAAQRAVAAAKIAAAQGKSEDKAETESPPASS